MGKGEWGGKSSWGFVWVDEGIKGSESTVGRSECTTSCPRIAKSKSRLGKRTRRRATLQERRDQEQILERKFCYCQAQAKESRRKVIGIEKWILNWNDLGKTSIERDLSIILT